MKKKNIYIIFIKTDNRQPTKSIEGIDKYIKSITGGENGIKDWVWNMLITFLTMRRNAGEQVQLKKEIEVYHYTEKYRKIYAVGNGIGEVVGIRKTVYEEGYILQEVEVIDGVLLTDLLKIVVFLIFFLNNAEEEIKKELTSWEKEYEIRKKLTRRLKNQLIDKGNLGRLGLQLEKEGEVYFEEGLKAGYLLKEEGYKEKIKQTEKKNNE